jgi:leader peptidase (prepilin peptidase) / N-methyltransferase
VYDHPVEIATLAALGTAIGSFLNVVVYRLPRRKSIARGRSVCPSCGTKVVAYDNIPIVSWALLRGRCRRCREPISIRYPAIELLTGMLFVAVGLRASSSAELLSGLVMVAALVAVAAIDLEHRIVPNRVLAPVAVAGLLVWAIADLDRLSENLIAGVVAGGFLLVFAVAYPAGMGMGDVKLAAVMGFFLGRSVAPALFLSFAVGAVVGIAIMLARGASARKHAIPFAPYLALGGVVGQLFGSSIVDWYLGLA